MSFISGISMEIYLCHMMFYRVVEKVHIERIFSDNDVVYIINCVLVLLSAGMFSYVWKKWGEAHF